MLTLAALWLSAARRGVVSALLGAGALGVGAALLSWPMSPSASGTAAADGKPRGSPARNTVDRKPRARLGAGPAAARRRSRAVGGIS